MCRYGQATYKYPFACFDCRKVFKQRAPWDMPDHLRLPDGEERVVPCPQCRRPMADIGRDFRAPKQSDTKQWKKVQVLFAHGFNFHSCGCCGPGYRPEHLREVKAFLESVRPASEGEALLRRLQSP